MSITQVTCACTEHQAVAPVFTALGADVVMGRRGWQATLANARIHYRQGTGGLVELGIVDTEPTRLSGIAIASASPAAPGPDGVRLDHVAIGVADAATAERQWADLLAIEPVRLGVHPVSGGAFEAIRFILGDQMIELVSPVIGVDSAIARRIARHGDGPVTLALPVADLPATISRLAEIGAGLIHADPHVLLHPKCTGGVLVQLTARVDH